MTTQMKKYTVRINCPCYEDIEVFATNEKEAEKLAISEFNCPGGAAEFCEILSIE